MALKNIRPLLAKFLKVKNRETLREQRREINKFLPELMDPVNKFLDEINNEEYKYTYAESYAFWGRRFEQAAKICKAKEKPKYTAIDKNYFIRNFKPLETWPKVSQ